MTEATKAVLLEGDAPPESSEAQCDRCMRIRPAHMIRVALNGQKVCPICIADGRGKDCNDLQVEMAIIEHAVPCYVPEARGNVTHDVVCVYPAEPMMEPVVESVPCCGLLEADAVGASKRSIGAQDIRIVRRGMTA